MTYLLLLFMLNCFCSKFYCSNNDTRGSIEANYDKINKFQTLVDSKRTDILDLFKNGVQNEIYSDKIVFNLKRPDNEISDNPVSSEEDRKNFKKVKRDASDSQDTHMMIGTFQAIMRPMSAGNLGVVEKSKNSTT
ncbi:jg4296 [Pararge aegeria aegeria]|uniref:Jg4296 protein n=1 Tax=Pararge aegeria aegeria TaxID=348720 RepID=A0A8S4RLE6_9NEOP|nr:jg4296 [Pararge aegeria aegeria]